MSKVDKQLVRQFQIKKSLKNDQNTRAVIYRAKIYLQSLKYFSWNPNCILREDFNSEGYENVKVNYSQQIVEQFYNFIRPRILFLGLMLMRGKNVYSSFSCQIKRISEQKCADYKTNVTPNQISSLKFFCFKDLNLIKLVSKKWIIRDTLQFL
ncbi:unnamed protein product [Paramecium sonneborni]|uniref:Uncharacterized protein n=1 Tax=Paramecium sonneborni TaxID=65129 RepID=A0A8S1Q9T6_9CILI|nr:unnamed protein product [Paramecium sonneborni]